MSDFVANLHHTLQQHKLTQNAFLLAYSGGLDSTALLSFSLASNNNYHT